MLAPGVLISIAIRCKFALFRYVPAMTSHHSEMSKIRSKSEFACYIIPKRINELMLILYSFRDSNQTADIIVVMNSASDIGYFYIDDKNQDISSDFRVLR